jgi:NDP-mannose synthase
MSYSVILQAGGKGTRLRPYTTVLPKPLMPVGEVPVLEIVIRQLAFHGFKDVYISTGHLAHLIESYFGRGSSWDVDITYLREPRPLGTIGPVRLLSKPKKPFLVMNGDLLTDLNYRALYDFHLEQKSLLTVAVYREEIPVSLGVIDFDRRRQITGFKEKPKLSFWASMGVYVFSPEIWEEIPTDTYYGFDCLVEDMLAKGQPIRVFPWTGIWLDIGRPEDYERAGDAFKRFKRRLMRG